MTTRVPIALLLLLVGSISGAAQNPGAGIQPQKRALIKELYIATRVDQMAANSASIMIDQLDKQLPAMLSQVLGDSLELKGKPREEFERAVIEGSQRVNARLKELLPQRINWAATMEQIFYPIYDKHFTEEELKDLVAFYKSPTGQKAIEVMPDLLKESLEKASELMNPKLMQLINQVLEEEKQHILKK